jgi:amino acid permease
MLGGSIGAGLFVGSGSALSTGGPASLTLGFIVSFSFLLFFFKTAIRVCVTVCTFRFVYYWASGDFHSQDAELWYNQA